MVAHSAVLKVHEKAALTAVRKACCWVAKTEHWSVAQKVEPTEEKLAGQMAHQLVAPRVTRTAEHWAARLVRRKAEKWAACWEPSLVRRLEALWEARWDWH